LSFTRPSLNKKLVGINSRNELKLEHTQAGILCLLNYWINRRSFDVEAFSKGNVIWGNDWDQN